VQRSEREPLPGRVLELDKYHVQMMTLTWPKVFELWGRLKKYRTLFSDLTRGDFNNFVNYVSSPNTLWLEIHEGERLSGVVVLEDIGKIIDAEAHVIFLDRDLASKVPICKAIIKWLFKTLPLQRLTVQIPEIYFAPIRLVNSLGFKREGKKRQAVLIGGKWIGVFILGLTRSEALKV
jgi:uncharacterized protein DUF2824/GNAT acetyltransferase-like protein